MTDPNTLTAEKIAELIESAPPEGQPCECTWAVYCDICFVIKNNLRYFLSSAEQVAALQQRVGELEAEVHRQNCLMADRGHDNERLRLKNSTLEAALAEAELKKIPDDGCYCCRESNCQPGCICLPYAKKKPDATPAEARKMPEWIKEELDLKRRMVDACKNLSPDTCIDCLRDQKFIQAAMQHYATPAKEKP